MNEGRQVNKCKHLFKYDRKCSSCGQYNYKNQAIKTTKYTTPFHFNHNHYLKSLRKSSAKIVEPHQIGEQIYQLLNSICQKFLFTDETLALGIYIYQFLNKLHSNGKFWSSAALIVAAKALQLDKNVPYLNRYQRYAEKSFSQQEYEQAERSIFQALSFDVQYSTFITFLDFYLTCGVVFVHDGLNHSLVEFFEEDVIGRAKEFLRKGAFTKYKPQLLALGIIKEIRLKYSLKGWNGDLQELTGYRESQIISVNSYEPLLREISNNTRIKLGELKGACVRKKYQNLLKTNGDKYTSMSKPTLKQNSSYSTSKLLQPVVHRKLSQNSAFAQGLASLNSDMLSKRR